MKILIRFIFMAVSLTAGEGLLAQKLLQEVTLVYHVTVTSKDENQPVTAELQGIRYTIFLKGAQSRTEMTSSLGTESTIFNPRSSSGYIIKEYGSTKLLIQATHDEWEDHNRTYSELSFAEEQGSFALGKYSCRKAQATLPSGNKITVYYDPSLVFSNKNYNLAFSGLSGLPVSFELEQSGYLYKYELASLSTDPVSYSRFDVPAKGYRTISYAELKSISQGN